jgi:hypothetical protein
LKYSRRAASFPFGSDACEHEPQTTERITPSADDNDLRSIAPREPDLD